MMKHTEQTAEQAQAIKMCKTNPAYEKKLLNYFGQCILSEGSKVLIFSLLFLKLELFPEFLAALLLLMVLRMNGGGIHCKHYWSCFLLSLVVLAGSIFLAGKTSVPAVCMQFAALSYVPIGAFLVPAVSVHRPKPSKALIERCKRNTIVILSIYFLVLCFAQINFYLQIGFWIITFHIVQLFAAKILKGDKSHVWYFKHFFIEIRL